MSLVKHLKTISLVAAKTKTYNFIGTSFLPRLYSGFTHKFLTRPINNSYHNIFCRSLSSQHAQTAYSHKLNDQEVDASFRRADRLIRLRNFISKNEIEKLYFNILQNKSVTSIQALFLIRCCSNIHGKESIEGKRELVSKIWNTLNSFDVQMIITHYNVLLNIYLEYDIDFSPIEFLETLKNKDIPPNQVTLIRLLQKFCQDGNIEGANNILSFMKENDLNIDVEIFNNLILGNSRANDLEGAKDVLEIMKESNIEPDSKTYKVLLQVYSEHNNRDEIMDILQKYDEGKIFIDGNSLLDLIIHFSESKNTEGISEIFQRLKSFSKESSMKAINRLIQCGDIESAYKICQVHAKENENRNSLYSFFMRELAYAEITLEQLNHYCDELRTNHYNVLSYEDALEGCLLSNNVNLSLGLMQIMKKSGISLRNHYFYPLLTSCKKSQDTESAMAVVKEMMAVGCRYIPMNDGDVVSDFIFPAVIGNRTDFNKVFYELNEVTYDWIQKSTVFRGFILCITKQHGLKEAAEFVNKNRYHTRINRMITRELIPFYKKDYDAQSLACILRQMLPFELLRRNHIQDVNKEQLSLVCDQVYSIVAALVQQGAVNDQLTPFLNALLEEGVRITDECMENIVKKFEGFITEEQKEILTSLTSDTLLPKKYSFTGHNEERDHISNRILDQLKKGNMSEAENILNIAKQQKLSHPLMLTIAKLFHQYDNLDAAEGIYQTILQESPGFQFNHFNLIALVKPFIKAGRVQDAIRILASYDPWETPERDMMKVRTIANQSMAIVKDVIETKDLDLVNSMRDVLIEKKYVSSDRMTDIKTLFFIETGQLDLAVKEYLEMKPNTNTSRQKLPLFYALIKNDKIEKLKEITDCDSTPHEELRSIVDLILAFIEAGKLNHAQRLLENVELSYQRVKNVFGFRLQEYVAKGKNNMIQDVLNVMKKNSIVHEAEFVYSFLLDSHISKGDTKSALDMYIDMQDHGVVASRDFHLKLGSFLKSNGCNVPFFISDTFPVQSSTTKVSTTQPPQKKTEISERSDILDDLIQGKHVTQRRLRSTFKHLLKTENLDKMILIMKHLNEESLRSNFAKTFLANLYSQLNRCEEYLTNIENPDKDKDLQNLYNFLPASFISNTLIKSPHLLPKIRQICEDQLKKGDNHSMNNLFNVFIMNERKEEAEQIFELYLRDQSTIYVNSCVNAAVALGKTQIIDHCIEFLDKHSNLERKEVQKGYLQTQYIIIAMNRNDVTEALKVVEDGLSSGLQLEHFKINALKKLKITAEKAGKPFPYDLVPPKSEANSSSSSSSSSDDEKKKN